MRKESFEKSGTPEFHTLNLPKDVILGVPIVFITGKNEMTIENYRGIIEYTDHVIRIKIKNGEIKISGTQLHISNYKTDDMRITGRFKMIEYI